MPSPTAMRNLTGREHGSHSPPKLFAALLAISLLFCTNAASAKEKNNNTQKEKTTTNRSAMKKKSVNKVTYQRSASEESPAQRDQRMFRECKGMHNAGACRGYTR